MWPPYFSGPGRHGKSRHGQLGRDQLHDMNGKLVPKQAYDNPLLEFPWSLMRFVSYEILHMNLFISKVSYEMLSYEYFLINHRFSKFRHHANSTQVKLGY